MKCIGIVWSPAWRYGEQIVQMMKGYCEVEKHFTINVEHNFPTFVRAIYPEVPYEWVFTKVERMANDQAKNLTIVYFDIDTTDRYIHPRKGYYVFTKIQTMKDDIRNAFKDKVENYVFDVVFHCSESDKEYEAMDEAIKQNM